MNFKRISLNLIHYFQDYRQLSRICLNKNIKTINDLQNYICETFNIENSFYIISNNFFLPPSENIELLDDNELIYVMPDFQNKKQICKEIKIDKKTESKEVECNEIKDAKKKKKKDKSKKKYTENEPKPYHLKDTQLNEIIEISNKIINNTSNINNNMEIEICNNSNDTQNLETNVEIDETIVNSELSESRPRKKRRCISPRETIATEKNKVTIQSVEIVNENIQQKIIDTLTKSPVGKSYSLNDVIDFRQEKQSTNSAIGNKRQSEQPPIETQLNGNGVEKTKRQLSKEILGIGHFLQNLSESDTSSFLEDNFITKRRRSRVRRRKKKNIEENQDQVITNIEFKPPKTIANPKIHIKFDKNEIENGENESFVCSTPVKITENVTINSTENTIINFTLNDIDANKCSNLLGMPNVNDLIKFKKLKIGENYTPEVSNYILAAVEDVTPDQKLKMKILDGKTEFREPMGRFSCITEEDDNLEETDEVVLALNNLIEPKLCKV